MKSLKPHALFSLLVIALAAGCAAEPKESITVGGVSLRPPGASELQGALPQNSIYLFADREFKGNVSRIENITAQPAGLTEGVSGRADNMTSLKWDLPAGVIVVFYENADGTGNQFPIWGRGQLDSVSRWAFNDKLSRWAWYPVNSRGDSSVARAEMGPHLSRPTTSLPRDMLELYTDRDLKGTVKMIGPVTSQSQLHYHSVDPLPDQITSMRWNLPEGVLVIFYDNFDGTGRQLVIWNKGEFESVSPFTMNDKISSYSWYRIGESSSR